MDIDRFMRAYQHAWQTQDEHAFAALFTPDG